MTTEYDSQPAEELAKRVWRCAELLREYNSTPADGAERRDELLTRLLGARGERLQIRVPFHANVGTNIFLGENVFINMNCTFLDDNVIRIGDNALIAPNVQIYTAFHPTGAKDRRGLPSSGDSFEFCKTRTAPVTIGNNVWIGGDTVIGAGSVVTKDIPAGKIACGNPCRIIRDNS